MTEILRKFIVIADNWIDQDNRVLREQQQVLDVLQRLGALRIND